MYFSTTYEYKCGKFACIYPHCTFVLLKANNTRQNVNRTLLQYDRNNTSVISMRRAETSKHN